MRLALLLFLALLPALLTACYPITWGLGPTPEPLVPTRIPDFRLIVTITPADADAALPTAAAISTAPPVSTPAASPTAPARVAALPSPSPEPSPQSGKVSRPKPTPAPQVNWAQPASARDRVGVGVPLGGLGDYAWGADLPGWYLNWQITPRAPHPANVPFAPMVRLSGDGFRPALDEIVATAAGQPGALWLIGNEPDVMWQDNVTAEQYAAAYSLLYSAIKAADPTAQVAIGGVSVPTPLRLAYLDRILAVYQARYGRPMPVDVWNVHAFILREERSSWGVGIPPGMVEDKGQLYEIADHADIAIFRRQIVAFRQWMADRGLRDKPLIVTEYGILMPDSYGFPPARVSQFMADTFDFFLTARDPAIGYPADDDRLVQAFCWYSVADTVYPTANLFAPQTRAITPTGEVFRAYLTGLQ